VPAPAVERAPAKQRKWPAPLQGNGAGHHWEVRAGRSGLMSSRSPWAPRSQVIRDRAMLGGDAPPALWISARCG